jgi:hypothetical protein
MHVVAFLLAIPGGTLLIIAARGAAATVGASIYTAGLLLGFGTSAGYHRLAVRPRTQAIMQRMDHSMIFVLIAGSYTPICLLGLPSSWGIPLLCIVWAGALTGVLIKQFAFEKMKVLEYALYRSRLDRGRGAAECSARWPPQLSCCSPAALHTWHRFVQERPNPSAVRYHEILRALTVAKMPPSP